jgi:signal peptidase I
VKNPFAREKTPKAEKSAGGQLLELVVIVAVALGLALGIQAFLVKPYRIPSESMVPTLQVGQRVLVNRIGNTFNDPKIGEIMVFHPPKPANGEAPGQPAAGGTECGVAAPDGSPCPTPYPEKADVNFIKRVVAGPGDRVSIVDGHVILNGESQADKEKDYINPCAPGDCTFRRTLTVPPDHWFMMGDNRGESDDSRYWGPVPKEWIIGNAFATYWPPSRIGLL